MKDGRWMKINRLRHVIVPLTICNDLLWRSAGRANLQSLQIVKEIQAIYDNQRLLGCHLRLDESEVCFKEFDELTVQYSFPNHHLTHF